MDIIIKRGAGLDVHKETVVAYHGYRNNKGDTDL